MRCVTLLSWLCCDLYVLTSVIREVLTLVCVWCIFHCRGQCTLVCAESVLLPQWITEMPESMICMECILFVL